MPTFQYLKPENLVERFRDSQQYTEGLTDNFFEYERLMRNKPHGSIPKEYPKTTDGTLASIIRKTPHRIIQQLPTGKVKSTTNDWLSVVASFIYTDKIIPNANEGYALLQKCWMVVEKFLGFGSCPTYAPFVNHGGYFCTDLRLPYWGDMFLQPGKISDEESQYVFMRSWWQTADIDALIASQEKLGKGVDRTWDIEALRAVKNIESTKDEKAKTPSEREKSINTKGGVELITGFQRGVKSKFYTFHVQTTGTGKDKTYIGTIVRTKINKDPRGELPVSFAYGDIDGSNPLGRSIIDLTGSLQNLMDGEMQMYQYNRALQLNPPLIKRGNFSKNKIKFAPNVIIDVGSQDKNVANVEPLIIDSTALANFPNNYGLMKSQMLNLLASPDTSISAEIGNPGFSKTPQGVEASKANLSIDDNYVRKQFETWFERWSETAINLYFAEREGVEELQLNKKTAEELRKLAAEGKFDPSLLSDDNKIRINYSTATEALKFEVDASTSKMKEELQELQSLQGLSEFLDKSEFLQGIIPPQKSIALWNAIVDNSGTENPENLKLDDQETQQAIQKMAEASPPPRENLITNYKDLPEDIKRQQEENLGFQPSQMASPTQQQTELKAAQTKIQAASSSQPEQVQPDTSGQYTPDHALKQQEIDNKQEIERAKLVLEAKKIEVQEKGQEQQAKTAAIAAKQPKPKTGAK
jgi:hypothetical protein